MAPLLDQLEQALLELVQLMRDMETKGVSQGEFRAGLAAYDRRWIGNTQVRFRMRRALYRVMVLVSKLVMEESLRSRSH